MRRRTPFPTLSRRAALGGLAASVLAGPMHAVPALAQRQQRQQRQQPQEQGEAKRLRIFNWDDHLSDQTLEAFARATGIDVEYDYYRSNEEMLETLVDGPPVHDLVMPSDYMVDLMRKRGLVQRIDHRRLPNLKHLIQAKPFQDPPYNPGLHWGVPHLWGSAGIGYRRSRVVPAPASWKALYDSERHKGRIALPGDAQVLLGCAAKYLGQPLNTTDPAAIGRMRDLVLRQKPNLRLFTPGGAENLLLVDDVDLGFCWSGDIFPVLEESPEIGYAVPDEGAPLWVHTMCVPAKAPRPGNAHLFMNFVLDPQVSAQIVQTTRYATANESARKLVPAALRDNPAVWAPMHVLPKCETFSDLEDAQKLYDEAWAEIVRG